jgi:hypothetical protein
MRNEDVTVCSWGDQPVRVGPVECAAVEHAEGEDGSATKAPYKGKAVVGPSYTMSMTELSQGGGEGAARRRIGRCQVRFPYDPAASHNPNQLQS